MMEHFWSNSQELLAAHHLSQKVPSFGECSFHELKETQRRYFLLAVQVEIRRLSFSPKYDSSYIAQMT